MDNRDELLHRKDPDDSVVVGSRRLRAPVLLGGADRRIAILPQM